MPADFVSKGIVIVMTRELSEEQLVRRIKLHTLLALLGAVIAVASLAGQYVIFVALGVTLPENLALGIFYFTQLPFAILCGVMGIIALLYGVKNATWRAGRIATFVLAIVFILFVVMPLVMRLLLSMIPIPAGSD